MEQAIKIKCKRCKREFHMLQDDAIRAFNPGNLWLDVYCKHCACLVRGYHRWSITDLGRRICADCFIRRIPLSVMVAAMQQTRQDKDVRVPKRDAVPGDTAN